MSVKICPVCQSRIVFQKNSGDFVHDCRNTRSTVLANEDVVKIGNYEDYAGSGTIPKAQVMNQGDGVTNRLRGSRAFVEDGETYGGVTKRGNHLQTHRTRHKLSYIENPDEL
jgi:hypothetical protein